jgi:predicted dehydrogenase
MVKFAVVGMGPIGSMHIDNLRAGKVDNAELACVCEQRPVDDPKYADVKIYKDIDEMLGAGGFDAVIISTPSFTHFGLGKKSLEAGYHTLIEKPIALCTADAIELQEIAKKCGKTCAIMLNQRTTPLYVRIKELIDNGEIGKINRISWTMSNWYRPDIYFSSSPWRGTWKGEAGGALINQSIHNIDIWAWAFGMPEKLRAWCKYGKYHDIEVEDEVICHMDLKDGASATFITSTGEHPGANRLEIAGDKAFVVAEGGKLSITRFVGTSLSEYTANTLYMFGSPDTEETIETFEGNGEQHVGVLKNFVGALEGKNALDFDCAQGELSLELANAMLMSSWTESEVSLPLDHAGYKKMLDEKIATSKLRENPKRDAIVDFKKSFR